MVQIEALINAGITAVWEGYNNPNDIQQWNAASPDWHCPHSENDLREGGRFKHTMAAKDGSFQFDFSGTYEDVVPQQKIAYTLDDQRKVFIDFEDQGSITKVQIHFETEKENPEEFQKEGWQAILNNFKNYIENK